MDLVIRDAHVIDGTGTPAHRADVAIGDGRIVEIHPEHAPGPRPTARRTLDADGLALSPGFIDMHAHSDLALLRDPDHSAKAAQGVTLEVLGQDGLSYAPVDDRTLAEVRKTITGWNGDGSDLDFDWRTVGGLHVRETAYVAGRHPACADRRPLRHRGRPPDPGAGGEGSAGRGTHPGPMRSPGPRPHAPSPRPGPPRSGRRPG